MTAKSTDQNTQTPLPSAVICCAVLEDEVRSFARDVPQLVAIHVLSQGLHNTPALLREKVQAAIDEVEQSSAVQSISLVYGLCSRGIEGIVAHRARLVIPRAHDCITLLLGSKQRYAEYVRENPGTYWYSPGWNRHHTPPGEERFRKALEDYRARFAEDDAQYLMETEQAWFANYSRATYVDLGVNNPTEDLAYTRRCADWLGWEFDRLRGDDRLLKDLLAGPWDDERFLVLAPGESVKMTADDRVIERASPRQEITVRGLPLPETRP